MGCVDAEFFEILDGCWTKQVAPNSRHHEHIRATKTSRHCLIRALASESEIELLTENCFSRLREPVREGSQIDVGTSNHRNARAPRHVFLREPEKAESISRPRSCQRRRQGLAGSSSRLLTDCRIKFSAIVAFL